jgi:hypothetical protein
MYQLLPSTAYCPAVLPNYMTCQPAVNIGARDEPGSLLNFTYMVGNQVMRFDTPAAGLNV